MYAYVLVFVSAQGVISYSPPVASVNDCNIMKQAVVTVGNNLMGTPQCVRVELAKEK